MNNTGVGLGGIVIIQTLFNEFFWEEPYSIHNSVVENYKGWQIIILYNHMKNNDSKMYFNDKLQRESDVSYWSLQTLS